ncbi:MAG TPA: pyridoxamine 5'-phosphate oxidase family protein [Ktedonobacterales bacterium]|nr:pyridoxamine 5'-phosphate oxidase family protein [Ktedonobacterales bacterium]
MASLSDALVRQLLEGRYIASLATHDANGSIHMVAVWYLFEGDKVFVATSSNTRKARNLQSRPTATLMIDSRDPLASRGVTLAGSAQLLTGEASQKRNGEIHGKYLSEAALADPRVGPVFAAWDNVTIVITPSSVIAWDMRQIDEQAFGGALKSNPAYLLPLER